jgi:uncharacterized membrane protein
VSLDDWILALHVLAAFALVASMVGFWVVVVAARSAERPSAVQSALRLSLPFVVINGIGAVGTLVFGIWLALSLDGYEIWDGWIIAAIVLWVIASAAGGRLGAGFAELGRAPAANPEGGVATGTSALAPAQAGVLYAVMALGTLLLLIDMIWKPGA